MKKIVILTSLFSLISIVYAADKLEKITNINEFGYFTHTYYLNPNPELIDNAITFIGSSDIVSKQNARAPIQMSFSCLFSIYDPIRKEKWKNTIKNIEEPAKSLLVDSITKTPSALLGVMPISPAKNDMNWACFFATGDLQYLNEIISVLKHSENRVDKNLFLTAASAKWSLSSNAMKHAQVRVAIEAVKVGSVPSMRPIANEILVKSPQKIREETIEILQRQKKKGVW